jgi:hypothetical protein
MRKQFHKILEERDRPSLAIIETELAAYKRFEEAYRRGIRPLPELPGGERGPSNVIVLVWGGMLHFGLRFLGLVAKRLQLCGARIWAIQQQVLLDGLSFEPVSCGLNRALTELGLALLEAGDTVGAGKCLTSSSRVYPCPETTLFGSLDSRLWVALKEIPESAEIRAEYERMAKQFYMGRDWPSKRRHIPLVQRIKAIISALLGQNREAR